MTYLNFLVYFLFVPILVMLVITLIDNRRGLKVPESLRAMPVWAAISLHMLIALLYTTLWDNYLVATRVWWYDPDLVLGITIGWVPIEEYTFFLLQPLLAGLVLLYLMRRINITSNEKALGDPRRTHPSRYRWIPVLILAIIWLGSLGILVAGWDPGTYIALELIWALPPIALQFAFGGDILNRYRRLVILSILLLTIYLSMADFLAIGSGTWMINPEKSLGWLIGGVLPLEEFLFFLLTNTLITFGVVLFIAQESWTRIHSIRQRLLKPKAKSGLIK